MTGYRDARNFDELQDARAEHAGETGEPLTLAEAMRRLVTNVNNAEEGPCETRQP